MWISCSLLFIILLKISQIQAENPTAVIIASNVFRYNVEETVSANIVGKVASMNIKLYLQDYPERERTFSQKTIKVIKGKPQIVKMKVTMEDLPKSLTKIRHVYLVAESNDHSVSFKKEQVILVASHGGYMFIQTDKPIYTPGQKVYIRVIPLKDDHLPSGDEIEISIRNPQGIAIEQKLLSWKKEILEDTFDTPHQIAIGNWSLTAQFVNGFNTSNSVTFEIRRYVLPTFSVEINMLSYILPTDKHIHGTVIGRYVFGKKVKGVAFIIMTLKNCKKKIGKKTTVHTSSNTEANFKIPVSEFTSGGFLTSCYLQVDATMRELITGKAEKANSLKIQFLKTPFKFSFKRAKMFFHPGITYTLKVDTVYHNGKPKGEMLFSVSAFYNVGTQRKSLKANETFVSTEDGQKHISFDTGKKMKTLIFEIESWALDVLTSETVKIRAYESPSNVFLRVTTEKTKYKIGEQLITSVLKSTNVGSLITFIVLSRGKVVHQESKQFGTVDPTLHVRVTESMIPGGRIIAYFVNGNEIIVDSTIFEVDNPCVDELTISAIHPEVLPGEVLHLKLKGKVGQQVTLLGVDTAVYKLKDKRSLTRKLQLAALKKQDPGCGNGGGQNSIDVFARAGIAVITNTNLNFERRDKFDCEKFKFRDRRFKRSLRLNDEKCCNLGKSVKNPSQSSCKKELWKLLKNKKMTEECQSTFISCCEGPRGRSDNFGEDWDDDELGDRSISIYSDFRESMVISGIYMDSKEKTVKISVPHSITTWEIGGFGVSKDTHFCVAQPVSVVVKEDIFVLFEFPPIVKRLEKIKVKGTVYFYPSRHGSSKPILVQLSIHGKEGLCSPARPNKKIRLMRKSIPVNDGISTTFYMVPLKQGQMTLTFVLETLFFIIEIKRDLLVEAEGVTVSHSKLVVLDPSQVMQKDFSGFQDEDLTVSQNVFLQECCKQGEMIKDQCDERVKKLSNKAEICREVFLKCCKSNDGMINFKERQFTVIKLHTPTDAIPATEHASLGIVGNLLGTTADATIPGVASIMRMPLGCGEQTMIYYAPTVFAHHYLKAVHLITPDVEKKALKIIRAGYTRELTFRKTDGSFSAFSKRSSSTWLTAFVMKVFCMSQRFYKIENNIICDGIRWLFTKQEIDGSFTESAYVIHSEMMGGVNGKVAMTAYVVISMTECQCHSLKDFRENLELAVHYLEDNLEKFENSYALALITYALIRVNSPKKNIANKMLQIRSKDDNVHGTRYWELSNVGRRASVLDAELTAYALLAQLELGNIEYSHRIANFLIEKTSLSPRYGNTQEAIMVLQALASYATKAALIKMDLHITITGGPIKETITITNTSALQRTTVREVPFNEPLIVETVGTGVGQLAIEFLYNKKYENNPRFDLTVKTKTLADINLDMKQKIDKCIKKLDARDSRFEKENGDPVTTLCINVCVRYRGEENSGFSILEVRFPTGFQTTGEMLDKIKNDHESVDEYEISNRSAIIYFDKIYSTKDSCIVLYADQSESAGNQDIQDASIEVYNYYKPDERCILYYGLEEQSKEFECDDGDMCSCLNEGCNKYFEGKQREELQIDELYSIACENNDRAENVLLLEVGETSVRDSWEYIEATVLKEINKGRYELIGKKILLWRSKQCKNSLKEGETYIVFGKDPVETKDENGRLYKYKLTDSDRVIKYKIEEEFNEKTIDEINGVVNFLTKMDEEGCTG